MSQHYKILRNSNSFKLEEHVKIALAQGYYLVGGPFIFKSEFWCQAVARPVQIDSNGEAIKEPDMPWQDLPVKKTTPPWQKDQPDNIDPTINGGSLGKNTKHDVLPSIYDEHTPDFMKD